MNISSLCIYIITYKYIYYLTIFNFVITSFFTWPPLASINSGGLCTIHNGRNWKIGHFTITTISRTGFHCWSNLTGEAGGCINEAWRDHLYIISSRVEVWTSTAVEVMKSVIDGRSSRTDKRISNPAIWGGATVLTTDLLAKPSFHTQTTHRNL